MLKSWGIWKHRAEFYDLALTKRRFSAVLHSCFMIEERKPVLASSSFFSVDNKAWGDRFAAVTLNVVPISDTQTAVIVSYPKAQSTKARRYIAPIMINSGEKQLFELSYLLVDRAENFFMSPSVVDGWDVEKRQTIEKAFMSQVITGGSANRSSDLMLF